MKVLIVTEKKVLSYKGRFYTDGASPREFSVLAKRMDLHVLTPVFKADKEPCDLMEIDKGVTIHSLGPLKYFHAFPPVYAMFKTIFFTRRLCKRENVDAVIAKGPREIGMAGVLGAGILKVPVIYHHSLDWFSFPPSNVKGVKKYIIKFYRKIIYFYRVLFTNWILRVADKVATVSDAFRNDLYGRFNLDKKKVSIMTNTFTLRDELFNIKFSQTPRKNILYIGRIDANKNVSLLLKAFKSLKNKNIKDIFLYILGDGPDMEKCKKLACDLGLLNDIDFVGYVPNDKIGNYLKDCLALVIPSYSEAFGNVALEAMAAARPVIASSVGGLRELVIDNESGLLFDVYKEDALTEKIFEVISDTSFAKRLGETGRKIASNYTPEKTAEKWMKELNNLNA